MPGTRTNHHYKYLTLSQLFLFPIRRAPPSILNVLPGQPVELRVAKRTTDDYVPPKRSAFHGSGNRLGAPVPDIASSSSSTSTTMPGSFSSDAPVPSSSGSQPERAMGAPKFEVDQSKPTTSVQIRLADGTRSVFTLVLDIILPLSFILVDQDGGKNEPYTYCP